MFIKAVLTVFSAEWFIIQLLLSDKSD